MILSASRRTDIPAFYGGWFMNRLREGRFHVRNPFNPRQVSEIQITSYNTTCLVFWTKNPAPFIQYLEEITALGYQYYFLFTLNDYPEWELNLPSLKKRIITFKQLSEKIGKEKVVWRYDPIILSKDYDIDRHISIVHSLANQLNNFTEKCITSFLSPYKKTKKNMGEKIDYFPTQETRNTLIQALHQKLTDYSIELNLCSPDEPIKGISSDGCINSGLIHSITGKNLNGKRDRNQRKNCSCIPSVDIGAYNTCLHDCLYCYANKTATSAKENTKKHFQYSLMQIGEYNKKIDTLRVKS